MQRGQDNHKSNVFVEVVKHISFPQHSSHKASVTMSHTDCKKQASVEVLFEELPVAPHSWILNCAQDPMQLQRFLRESRYLLSSGDRPTTHEGFSSEGDYTTSPTPLPFHCSYRCNFTFLSLSCSHLCLLPDLIQSQEFKNDL